MVAYYKVDYEKDTKGTNYWRNRVLKVSEKMNKEMSASGDISVHFAVSSAQEYAQELSEMGLEPPSAGDQNVKPVVAAWNEKNQKFTMRSEFSYLLHPTHTPTPSIPLPRYPLTASRNTLFTAPLECSLLKTRLTLE